MKSVNTDEYQTFLDCLIAARKDADVTQQELAHNPDQTWTGRGVKPRWLAALVNEGRQIEEFLI